MRVGFIGDVVGRPGRSIIKENLCKFRDIYNIDFVIANCENASHGFGLSTKNAKELLNAGIDVITGGNHSWDKKDIMEFMKNDDRVLRPINYPDEVAGSGIFVKDSLAIINAMGNYGIGCITNPFTEIKSIVDRLKSLEIKNIVVDFHAESTAEKRAMYLMLQDRIAALLGTHTHIGTDDLEIANGSLYVSDVGLTGCRDGVIGMRLKEPLERFTLGISDRFEVPKECKKILQMVVFDLDDGRATNGFKLKMYDNLDRISETKALVSEG
ncbi:MAG: YmdB family metallophosphoesterase [Campylobacterales bacterium]